MSIVDKRCVECNNNGKIKTQLNLYICDNCKYLDKYILITKTKSKSEYLLSDEDLSELKSYIGKCAYGIATRYIKRDLILKAIQKFNTTEYELNNVLDRFKNDKEYKKEQNKIKKINKQKMLYNIRKINLVNALENKKLELRNDSVLCQKYITGDINISIDNIVNRMCQMKYLYDYCHMDKCKDIAYDEYIE